MNSRYEKLQEGDMETNSNLHQSPKRYDSEGRQICSYIFIGEWKLGFRGKLGFNWTDVNTLTFYDPSQE